ncbi:MAG: hypothetical protein EBZ24_14400, partial [Synechococcaceae bacterium WB9_4xB_025]|nr:hypothetical protein [Synechococcaceae bacterium WB9_4xB_025]
VVVKADLQATEARITQQIVRVDHIAAEQIHQFTAVEPGALCHEDIYQRADQVLLFCDGLQGTRVKLGVLEE